MRCPLKSPATQWCQAMGLVLQVVEKRESTLVLLMSHPPGCNQTSRSEDSLKRGLCTSL